jgi:alpha-beta hydrolase superfamily lysophospholipase
MYLSSDQASRDSSAGKLPEALYFDSGERRLFGWLHAAGLRRGVGLVICKPFGYEAICSHRSLRSFAEAAAAAGIPALRFDYVGTGDSSDMDPHADQIELWTDDVIAAVAELQRQTAVERVCLLGFRLGALLAALAARRCPAIAGLALISPVISGRRYVREMRTTRLASSMGMHPAAASHAAAAGNDGSMEVSGFSFSAATLAALAQVDLQSGPAPAAEMLIIDGSSMPVSRAWATQLTEAGVRTQYAALPGMIEMLMTAPQLAVVPKEMVAETCGWLGKFRPTAASGASPTAAASAAIKSLPLPDAATLRDAVLERPVWFGTEAALFGIVSEPQPPENRRRAVILLNAGADFHIGASGIYVGLARYWAARGCVVLRMDFAGIGDSGTRPGRPDQEVFPAAAVQDMRDAIEWLRGQYDIHDFTLCGICSGAYHALRGAAERLPVNRVLLVNPQNYFWKEGMSITGMQVSELVGNVPVYRQRMFSAATWQRLLTGQIHVGYITTLYLRRAVLSLESATREVARRLRIPLPSDLGWELEQIASRGVDVVFVFARGEPGVDLLKLQGGSSVARLGARCRIHMIDNADHVFSKAGPRAILRKILSDELFATADVLAPLGAPLERSA